MDVLVWSHFGCLYKVKLTAIRMLSKRGEQSETILGGQTDLSKFHYTDRPSKRSQGRGCKKNLDKIRETLQRRWRINVSSVSCDKRPCLL